VEEALVTARRMTALDGEEWQRAGGTPRSVSSRRRNALTRGGRSPNCSGINPLTVASVARAIITRSRSHTSAAPSVTASGASAGRASSAAFSRLGAASAWTTTSSILSSVPGVRLA
jgi:hypothetical protein